MPEQYGSGVNIAQNNGMEAAQNSFFRKTEREGGSKHFVVKEDQR